MRTLCLLALGMIASVPADEIRPLPLAVDVEALEVTQVDDVFDCFERKLRVEFLVLCRALEGPQMTLRAMAATALGDSGDWRAIPFLIDALSDPSFHDGANYANPGDAATRHRAGEALKKITRKDFGFVWNDPGEKRNEAIGKWAEWFRTEVQPKLSPIMASNGSVSSDPGRLAEAAERGKKSAAVDIKAKRFRILYHGEPTPNPGNDTRTGWPLVSAAGCRVTPELEAEVKAYNEAMVAWHAQSTGHPSR